MLIPRDKVLQSPAIGPDRLIFWGLCALFFALPLATSGVSLAGGLVIAVWLFSGKFFRQREIWLNQSWTKPVILFMLLPWAGLLWTPDLREGLDWASKSHVWLIAFAAVCLTYDQNHLPLFLKSFLAGLALVAVITLLQYFSIVPIRGHIPSLLESGRITGSLFLVFGMAIVSFEYSRLVTWRDRALHFLVLALFFVTLLVSGGRAGYLALILLLPLIVQQLIGGRHLLVKVGAGLAVLAVIFSFPQVIKRTAEVGQDIASWRQIDPNTSVGVRLHMWEGAVKIFLDNPLLGVGTGGYRKEMKKYGSPRLDPLFHPIDDPHNNFLFMAANFGLVGLFSLGWLFYVFLKKGWRSRTHRGGFAVLAFGLVLIIGGMTGTEIHSFHSAHLFALLMGLTVTPDIDA